MINIIIVLSGITVLMIFIRVWLAKKRVVQETGMIRTLQKQLGTNYRTIISVDYASPKFKSIDQLLANGGNKEIIIFFSAPDWLINIKGKAWKNHFVVNSRSYSWFTPLLRSNPVLVQRYDRIFYFSDSYEYLRFVMTEKEELIG
ncbi:hypothetical protein [Brevibacillus laterosporus]|uniref:Uncharacterized protein n=1 Tax=Brevibacillus laterosporus TaxID=1465 RepID=A0AAP8QDU6_BRELA|nr:hypothetical protein [Brevibacillus laterosporus]MCR8979767.1 hypothetical protein [Brevibacillus laterosporus]MCZ0806922.1 hypothetical protein [Brevibacillus laterosporus]MCZ0825197.1 hypothetical protein [Brevibacillus laterosporus]MCZ0849986.1 hypothetical protein [Brevibacillus laterosporus]MED1666978.1 hypothetical protein [Brevibacillus laterosporus]